MAVEGSFRFVRRDCCPACRSTQAEALHASNFAEGEVGDFVRRYYRVDPGIFGDAAFELVRCARCSLIYQLFVGDTELLGYLYGELINDSNRPDDDPDYLRIMRRPRESRDAHEMLTVAAYLKRDPSALTTLDYGMGWAMWARAALDLGCNSYGAEFSADRREFAQRHGVKTLPIDGIPPDTFDFINCEQVMEHVTALSETCERLAAALKPGGILKISVPNAEGVMAAVAKLNGGQSLTNDEFMPIQPLEHVNSFTSKALTSLAANLGLRLVRPSYIQRYAFLVVPSAIGARYPRNLFKELLRPFYTYRSRTNLYVWMQRP